MPKELRRMNVHHASLFPDLIGSSQYCNSLIAEEALQLAETKQLEKTKEMENEEESPSLTEAGKEVQSATGTPDIVAILKTPDEAAQVEPGRIVFMAEELQRELAKTWSLTGKIENRPKPACGTWPELSFVASAILLRSATRSSRNF